VEHLHKYAGARELKPGFACHTSMFMQLTSLISCKIFAALPSFFHAKANSNDKKDDAKKIVCRNGSIFIIYHLADLLLWQAIL
jgi:hypothetical protein